jgi:hypothetical protein
MKVGLDFHGVINKNPKFFAEFTAALVAAGHEVHIITGPHQVKVEPDLKKWKIQYTHFFSIVEYEEKRGVTEIVWAKNGDPFMNINVWERAKALYCKRKKIDLHIDDSHKYGEYFETPFCLYKTNPQKRKKK